MHRAVMIRLAAALALVGCDSFEGAYLPEPPPSASLPEAGADEALRFAKPVADRGLELAKQCVILAPYFDDAADKCELQKASIDGFAAALSALSAHAKAHPDPIAPEARRFVAAASLFAEWIERTQKLGRTRGTLKLFQDFADAWNAYQPAQPLPVDPVNELWRAPIKGFNRENLPKRDGRVVWKPCMDGPCIWEDRW